MYKFFLYSVLMILYLILAKTLSPSEIGIHYLQNEKGFTKIIKGTPTTAILIDTHATGFLIKTYYQKYRIISGYDKVEEMIVRTNKDFARKNLPYIGMSIYRRNDKGEDILPLPPGTTYLGNREFGEWRKRKDGSRFWRFNKSFKNFPRYLGWGDFRPSEEFFQMVRSHETQRVPFYGLNNEFGPEGKITQENFPQFFRDSKVQKVDFKTLMLNYFKENF